MGRFVTVAAAVTMAVTLAMGCIAFCTTIPTHYRFCGLQYVGMFIKVWHLPTLICGTAKFVLYLQLDVKVCTW